MPTKLRSVVPALLLLVAAPTQGNDLSLPSPLEQAPIAGVVNCLTKLNCNVPIIFEEDGSRILKVRSDEQEGTWYYLFRYFPDGSFRLEAFRPDNKFRLLIDANRDGVVDAVSKPVEGGGAIMTPVSVRSPEFAEAQEFYVVRTMYSLFVLESQPPPDTASPPRQVPTT